MNVDEDLVEWRVRRYAETEKALVSAYCTTCHARVGGVFRYDKKAWWVPRGLPLPDVDGEYDDDGGHAWIVHSGGRRHHERERSMLEISEQASRAAFHEDGRDVSEEWVEGLRSTPERLPPPSSVVYGWCADHGRQEFTVANLFK